MRTFESDLGHKFAPSYHSSKGEGNCLVKLQPRRVPMFDLGYPPWEPFVYFSSRFLGIHRSERIYEINYLTIWEWDTGVHTPVGVQGSHQWDTERSAVLVAGQGLDLSSYRAWQVYYAAHEDVRWMKLLSFDNSEYFRFRRPRDHGPDVYWSEGKHASFRNLRMLQESTAHDTYGKPGNVARAPEYTLVDAGTVEDPSPEALWIQFRGGWGTHRISPVFDKLSKRLWDPAGNPLKAIRKVTEGEIKVAQLALDVQPTGRVDEETLEAAAVRLPSDLLWSTQEATDADVKLMARRDIDVSPLL